MTHTDILSTVNSFLAGEMLSWKQLVAHLNYTVDSINTQMNTKFPAFSTDVAVTEYTAIPDNYIRSVVIPGAVYHFYVVDEEGATAGLQFQQDFRENMFYMLRDYSCQIPDEYFVTTPQGVVPSMYEDSQGERGMYINVHDIYL